MSRIKSIEFKIKNTKDIIYSFERSIKKNKSKPRTRKRNFYLEEYTSALKKQKGVLRLLEIEKERLEKEGGQIR